MTNILLKSQKKIPKDLAEILQVVFDVSTELEIDIFVIGAIARDLIFEYVYGAEIQRATEDIDFGVAVRNWTEYERLKELLVENGNFIDDKRIEQRIWWKNKGREMKIDLVPYGGAVGGMITYTSGEFHLRF